MKRLIYILVILTGVVFTPTLAAQEKSTPTTAEMAAVADSAYTDDNFEMAADIYKTLIAEHGPSSKLYYNLGNCYYRLGRAGDAIVAYERALRLDPADKDARYNLDFVNARITDRPGERGTFIGNALDATSQLIKADLWAWVAFTFFVLTTGGLLLYFFTSDVMLRKTGFFGGIAALILFAITFFIARRATAIAMDTNQAVVVVPSTILSTVPREPGSRNQEAMLLHEGTRVEILDSVVSNAGADSIKRVWYDVQVDNSHRAWIDASAVERI